jgi:hypothetical protein
MFDFFLEIKKRGVFGDREDRYEGVSESFAILQG